MLFLFVFARGRGPFSVLFVVREWVLVGRLEWSEAGLTRREADLVPIGSYFNMLMGSDVRGRENW